MDAKWLEFNSEPLVWDRVIYFAEVEGHMSVQRLEGFWAVIDQKNQRGFAWTETMLPGSYDVLVSQMFTDVRVDDVF